MIIITCMYSSVDGYDGLSRQDSCLQESGQLTWLWCDSIMRYRDQNAALALRWRMYDHKRVGIVPTLLSFSRGAVA